MFANNSFYQGMLTFSGVTFGAFEFAWMQGTFMRADVWMFLGLCFCPLLYLAALKSICTMTDKKTYALSRPYRHILADFGYFISIAATFATLVFIYTRGLRLVDNDWGIPPYTAILIVNMVLYVISMGVYSLLAKEERIAVERATQ